MYKPIDVITDVIFPMVFSFHVFPKGAGVVGVAQRRLELSRDRNAIHPNDSTGVRE